MYFQRCLKIISLLMFFKSYFVHICGFKLPFELKNLLLLVFEGLKYYKLLHLGESLLSHTLLSVGVEGVPKQAWEIYASKWNEYQSNGNCTN